MGHYCATHGQYDYCSECQKDRDMDALRAELAAMRERAKEDAAAIAFWKAGLFGFECGQ